MKVAREDTKLPFTILMVIPYLGFGGAQRVFYNLSLELSNYYEIVECGFDREEGYAYPTNNKLVFLDVKGGSSYLQKLLNFLMRISRLKAIKKETNPIVTISHLEGADYINILSGGNERKIICIHGTKTYDKKINGFLGVLRKRILIPLIYRRADKIVCVSEGIRKEMINDFHLQPEKLLTINNWFDIERIQRLSEELIEEKYSDLFNKKTIVLLGRFDLQKNFINFIKVIKEVAERTNCKFIFLGDGDLRNEILEITERLKLSYYSEWKKNSSMDVANIVFLGFQSNPYKFLAKADLFVLPSDWEGFPMAIGEAMCCGLPVMAANCPTGPAEMLDYNVSGNDLPAYAEYGAIMPLLIDDVESIKCWSNEIVSIIEDGNWLKKYSLKSKERIVEYSKEKMLSKWISLIRQQ